jgi:hypothetical protein
MAFDSKTGSGKLGGYFETPSNKDGLERETWVSLDKPTPAEKKALKADRTKERPVQDNTEYLCWTYRIYEVIDAEKKKSKDGTERIVRIRSRWNTFEIIQLTIDDYSYPSEKEWYSATVTDDGFMERLAELTRPGVVGELTIDEIGLTLKFKADTVSFVDGDTSVCLNKSDFVTYKELHRRYDERFRLMCGEGDW